MSQVQLVVSNRVFLYAEKNLLPSLLARLEHLFTHANPQFAKLRSMGYAARGEPRVYKTWKREDDGSVSFPRGGLSRVREALVAQEVTWTVSDQRVEGEQEVDVEYTAPFGERPAEHQVEAVAALTARQNALLRIPTGGRKTSIAMMLVAAHRVPTLVLMDDSGLQDQWVERAGVELGLPEAEVGRIGGGDFKLRPLTIALVQSVVAQAKYPEKLARLRRYFGQVIVDECQAVACHRMMEAINYFPAKYRYGISASEMRRDGKECLTYDLFGAVAYEIDREELVRRGVILDVEIRVVETAFRAPWYGFDGATGDGDVDFNRLLDEMQADDARNALIVETIMREVKEGEQVIALAHRRDHCRILDAAFAARSVRSGFLIGGDDYAAQYDETKLGIRSGEVRVGVGTIKAIGQGIDVPAVAVGMIATPVAANRWRLNQMRGRFCRAPKGKTRAVLYVAWDSAIFPKHLVNLASWNPTVTIEEGGRWVPVRDSSAWKRVHSKKRTGSELVDE